MSINQLLNITRRSFAAFDAAMNTIGQNVANAETEGYSRRRVTMQAESTIGIGLLDRSTSRTATGNGVNVAVYERLRDQLLARSSWNANGWMGASEEEHRITTALQSLFSSSTDGSISNQLNAFWNSWSDLADNPTDNGVRMAVRGQGASLAATLNRMSAEMEHLTEETQRALNGGVNDVNKLLEEIAELNYVIEQGNSIGSPDLASEDRRDTLISKLSEYAGIRVQEEPSGSYTVTLNGMMIVSDATSETLKVDMTSGTPRVMISDTQVSLNVPAEGGGRLVGWLRTLQSTIPNTQSALDDIAETLVTEINALHSTGYDLDGNTGVDFFNGGGTTAATIRLSDAVNADSRAVVASAGDPSAGVNDSDIANALFKLSETQLMNGNSETVETFAINLVSGIGATAKRASGLYESHAAFASHVDAMAKGVSGVSLEEEMTDLIRYQQAFGAAARVLDSVQTMMDTLLNL